MNSEPLNKVSKLIRIDADKEEYTKHFDSIRDFIIKELRKDPLFKCLFGGIELAGSYADGAKINKPDEFDCYIFLDFNKISRIRWVKGKHPSTVHVNMVVCEKHMEQMATFTSRRSNILPEKINSWIHDLIEKILNKLSTLVGRRCSISLSEHGPAQTLTIQGRLNYSIDLVPCIKIYYKEYWISKENPVFFNGQKSYWVLVPKPIDEDAAAFKASYAKMENAIIHDKNHLKNAYRLLKKLRDKNELNPLKSYFIKTVCLWVDAKKRRQNFWSKPIQINFLVLLEKLLHYCKKGYLPSFWNRGDNLFKKITKEQMENIILVLRGELRKFKNGHCFKRFFNGKEVEQHRLS